MYPFFGQKTLDRLERRRSRPSAWTHQASPSFRASSAFGSSSVKGGPDDVARRRGGIAPRCYARGLHPPFEVNRVGDMDRYLLPRKENARGWVRIRTDEGQRWRPRPLLSFALRLVSVLVPAAAGAASAYGYVVTWPRRTLMIADHEAVQGPRSRPHLDDRNGVGRTRTGSRFLPLAVLLHLSLVFPDRAPSRFAMARRAGNVRVWSGDPRRP